MRRRGGWFHDGAVRLKRLIADADVAHIGNVSPGVF